MTGHEMVLLAKAVEAGGATFRIYRSPDDGWTTVETSGPRGYADGKTETGSCLADALTALLRDLGVEVPEPPSAERVEDFRAYLNDFHGDGPVGALRRWRQRYAREPQIVLALLDGGAS